MRTKAIPWVRLPSEDAKKKPKVLENVLQDRSLVSTLGSITTVDSLWMRSCRNEGSISYSCYAANLPFLRLQIISLKEVTIRSTNFYYALNLLASPSLPRTSYDSPFKHRYTNLQLFFF